MPLCDVARPVGSCLAVICLVEGTVALAATATLGKNVEVAAERGGGWPCGMGSQERGADVSGVFML